MKVRGYVQDLWSNRVFPMTGETELFWQTPFGSFRKDKSTLVDGHGPILVDCDEIEYKGLGLWGMKDDEETHAPVVNDGEDYSTVKPEYYHAGGIDVFKFMRANMTFEQLVGYHKATATKYIIRAGKKDPLLKDFRKAREHMDEIIDILQKAGYTEKSDYLDPIRGAD